MRSRAPDPLFPRWLLVAGAMVMASACGGASPPPVATEPLCPNDTPATCPSPAPMFAQDVAPVLAARCAPGCHAPGGVEAFRSFATWEEVAPQAEDMLSQVHQCRMPPVGSPVLTAHERELVLGWVVCGARHD